MVKVMLIDDEVLVRVGLKSLINWEENGYQIIAEASNGQEGLNLIRERKPEIVIVDIKMPLKDGITLIQEVREMNLATKFIVLSSFDDFKLVKKAMKLGAVDYLLKLELDEKELLKSLENAAESITSGKQNMDYQPRLNSLAEIKKKSLQKIIAAKIADEKQIKKIFEELKINLIEDKILCLTIKIDEKEVLEKFSQGDIYLYENSIIEIVDEIVSDFFNAVSFMNNWGEIVVFLNLDKDLVTEKEKIGNLNLRLHKMVKNYFSLSITIAISSQKNKFLQLSEAFIECSECLDYSFRCGEGKAIHYQNLDKINKLGTTDFISNFAVQFDECLEYKEIKRAVLLLEKVITKIKENFISRNDAIHLYFKITGSLEKNLTLEVIEQLCGSDNLYQNIDSITNNNDLINWMHNLSEKLKVYMDKKQENYLILAAKKYLKNNYSEDLSLERVAQEINISSGYLSYLFTEKSGISFIEYLNQLRISEARELLKDKKLKIYEIADQT
ncbi:YesN/AraC family two-component response regulator [Halanaerobium saccharolyticum]|uniref:Stage 0 sporulation protein A homolog n=1 Tax=Halanaerobium saccharolyticum TaxID=43595 RepID=A0A4R7YST5_9FIRM|nr:response regulator [Halanaerobium saccharolyticum]RAK05170.1 YesN/AraC family two-component response regulator [Halanaerobium saccharolyticum]TDV99001.1 YesN/AraC family two-component response regulator [Halanaerobium saccharolyticum]TDX51692.1 YesN/AraC family two-component response regulator [Halanaerobium saccharolyticum]